MRPRRRLRTGLACIVAALLAGAAAAQHEDEQTRDWEEQDRRYYERLAEPDERADAADSDEQAAAAFLARAEELVRDRNYWSRASEHYRVQTDDPGLDSKATLELLEGFRAFFERFWSGRVALKPYDVESRVFLYDSFYKYNELLGFDARRLPVRPQGHYISLFNVLVAHTRAGSPADFADSLVHEAAHQLIDQRIYGGSDRASPWVGEGLASYFGYTLRDKNGDFHEGDVGGKNVDLLRDTPSGGSSAGDVVKLLRRALKAAPESVRIDKLVSATDPAAFYGGDVRLTYAASWVLVHYLLHGDGGAHAAAFARYLETEAGGGGGPEALYRELGMDAEALQAGFEAWAGKLRTR